MGFGTSGSRTLQSISAFSILRGVYPSQCSSGYERIARSRTPFPLSSPLVFGSLVVFALRPRLFVLHSIEGVDIRDVIARLLPFTVSSVILSLLFCRSLSVSVYLLIVFLILKRQNSSRLSLSNFLSSFYNCKSTILPYRQLPSNQVFVQIIAAHFLLTCMCISKLPCF